MQEKVFYDCFDADSAIEKGQCDDADVIIVDPPRKGLNEGVLKFFTGKDAEKKLGSEFYTFCQCLLSYMWRE